MSRRLATAVPCTYIKTRAEGAEDYIDEDDASLCPNTAPDGLRFRFLSAPMDSLEGII